MTTLETAIVKTIAYFDIFDYPLTAFEVWQYLEQKTTLREVKDTLSNPSLPLERSFGFFFLPGRSEIITLRQERYRISDKKIKKLQRRLRLIQWLPGVRLICLANTIGTHNLRQQSDNDLLIITGNNQLWSVKLLATVVLEIFHLRPTEKNSTDTLCLSFLIDESALNTSHCRLETDLYFTYWLAGLIPLYGDPHIYKNLLIANPWLTQALPNWSINNNEPIYRLQKKTFSSHRDTKFKHFFEQLAQYIHKHIMAKNLQALANKNQQVIMTDHILKLHTSDRRIYFQTEHHKRLINLGLV